jgi:hypothetical protein
MFLKDKKNNQKKLSTGETHSTEPWRLVFAAVFIPMTSVDSPNVHIAKRRIEDGTARAQRTVEAYYECLVVLFCSARRWHPEARLILFTPVEVPNWFLTSTLHLNLEQIPIPFLHKPTDADSGRPFVSSLYTLDAIDWIGTEGGDDDIFLLLDADIVILGHVDATTWAQKIGYLGWRMDDGHDFNGLTLEKYSKLVLQSGLPAPREPEIIGGEFIAGSTKLFASLAKEISRVQDLVISCGQFLSTEEHYLSLALPYLPRDNSPSVVNRIWTYSLHRKIQGNESDLLIWHLPQEKGRGFHKVVAYAFDQNSWFWNASPKKFVSRMGRLMGVTVLTPNRVGQDFIWGVKSVIRRVSNGS